MTWFKPQAKTSPVLASKKKRSTGAPLPRTRHTAGSEAFLVPIALQQRIADLLVKHGRFRVADGRGHLRLQILHTTKHHDGSTDYSVRTFIQNDREQKVFNSHVRLHPSDHLTLIR